MEVDMVGSELQATSSTTERIDAARAVVRMARMLEHACTELSLPQYRLLVMVASGDQRASKLAGRLALSKPTVTAVVDGLVERGFMVRSGACSDRRAVDLSLTGAGRRALVVADEAMAQQLGRVLDRCDDPGHAERGLLQLVGAVERAVAERIADSAK